MDVAGVTVGLPAVGPLEHVDGAVDHVDVTAADGKQLSVSSMAEPDR